MSRFTRILEVSPADPDGKQWCVMKAFGYDRTFPGSGDTVEVPRGFVTDFASIPRIFWWILPKWGRYGNAAVVHDVLYWEQRHRGRKITRRWADDVMLEAMKELKVPGWKCRVIYGALRMGGWWAWKTNERNRESGFERVIEPERLELGYEHVRPGLLRQMIGRPKGGKLGSGPERPGVTRFSEALGGVVAPAALQRALARKPYGEDDEALARDLHAKALQEALKARAEAQKEHDEKLEKLTNREKQLPRLIDRAKQRVEKGPPEGPPARESGEEEAAHGERVRKYERERREHDQAVADLPELEMELELLPELREREVRRGQDVLQRADAKIREERDRAIVGTVEKLARATRTTIYQEPAAGFTLALAADGVCELLQLAVRDRRDEVVPLIGQIGAAVEEKLESEKAGQAIETGFHETAELLKSGYRKNLGSLTSLRTELTELPREEAESYLKQLVGLGEEPSRRKVWDLVEESEKTARRVRAIRERLQTTHLRAMSGVVDDLEACGLEEILSSWSLLGRGRSGSLGERGRRLCETLDARIAETLGLEQGERVERIAATRLLVGEAKTVLQDDPSMRFLEHRAARQRDEAERVSAYRSSLWWKVALFVWPLPWLALRGTMRSLREFFGPGLADADAPRTYRGLRDHARRLLLGASTVYGSIAVALPLALYSRGWPPADGPAWLRYGLPVLLAANFLALCVHLFLLARAIRPPRT